MIIPARYVVQKLRRAAAFYKSSKHRRILRNSSVTRVRLKVKEDKGKSTLLKKLLRSRACRGDYVRVIDVTGEFSDVALAVGGKVVYLDGNGGILNLFQINKVAEDDIDSYSSHISNLVTIYKFLAPESSHVEQLIFEDLLRQMYESYNMTPDQFIHSGIKITELPSKSYPILDSRPFLLPIMYGDRVIKYIRKKKRNPHRSGKLSPVAVGNQRIQLLSEYGVISE